MDRPEQLTAFQVDLAGIFFSLNAAKDYLVAGGAALLARGLIARPTEDLDLFAARPTTSVTEAKDDFVQALQERSCDVVIVQDGPTFPDARHPGRGADPGRPRDRLPTPRPVESCAFLAKSIARPAPHWETRLASRTGADIVDVMSDHQKEADDRLAQLLAAEALAAEEAEAFSDPDEPLPPHVKVTRGRTFDDLLRRAARQSAAESGVQGADAR